MECIRLRFHFWFRSNLQDLQDDLRQPLTQNSVPPRINPSLSNAVLCRTPECRDQMQVQHCDSTRSFSNYPVCQSNNVHRTDGPSFHHKAYPPRPQHPPPSNQFSYVQANQHVKSRREIPPPSYFNRFQHSHDFDCGNFYNNHERMRPGPYELNDGWRFPAPFPGMFSILWEVAGINGSFVLYCGNNCCILLSAIHYFFSA